MILLENPLPIQKYMFTLFTPQRKTTREPHIQQKLHQRKSFDAGDGNDSNDNNDYEDDDDNDVVDDHDNDDDMMTVIMITFMRVIRKDSHEEKDQNVFNIKTNRRADQNRKNRNKLLNKVA